MIFFADETGFTLIEVVLVVFIIGILSAVGVPKYLQMQDEAIEAACQANMKAIESEFIMKYTKALLSDATTDFTSITVTASDFTRGEMPVCPEDGSAYTLVPNANGTLTVTCPNGHTFP